VKSTMAASRSTGSADSIGQQRSVALSAAVRSFARYASPSVSEIGGCAESQRWPNPIVQKPAGQIYGCAWLGSVFGTRWNPSNSLASSTVAWGTTITTDPDQKPFPKTRNSAPRTKAPDLLPTKRPTRQHPSQPQRSGPQRTPPSWPRSTTPSANK